MNFFVILGCTKPQDPPALVLSKDNIKDITDKAYSAMMAQTDQSLLWDDRKTFTNYVLYMRYDKGVPVIEIHLTNANYGHSKGYRYHTCIYDFKTDSVTFVKGMNCVVE